MFFFFSSFSLFEAFSLLSPSCAKSKSHTIPNQEITWPFRGFFFTTFFFLFLLLHLLLCLSFFSLHDCEDSSGDILTSSIVHFAIFEACNHYCELCLALWFLVAQISGAFLMLIAPDF
jgi:hypothetical protein